MIFLLKARGLGDHLRLRLSFVSWLRISKSKKGFITLTLGWLFVYRTVRHKMNRVSKCFFIFLLSNLSAMQNSLRDNLYYQLCRLLQLC